MPDSRREPLGVVLAGGDSRRMGRDKALLEWRGQTLLERAVATLRQALAEVIVVGDRQQSYGFAAARTLPDRRAGLGPLGGLETALEVAAGRPVFVLACDLPRVSPELLGFVLGAVEPGDLAVAPVAAGVAQPLCAFYDADCRDPLAEFLAAGRRAATGFLDHVAGRRLELGPELPFFSEGLLLNINRPGDLDAVEGGDS